MLWLHGVFSDQQWDIHHVLAEGDMVAVHCTMRATHSGDLMGIAPTGRQVEMDYIHLLRFEEGRVKDRWAVRDDIALMRQLGALGGAPGVSA
jgi:predicted ester cyclase